MRKMSFEPRDCLRHILVEADYLIGQSAGLSFEAFAADETLRRACVRSLEVIGDVGRGEEPLLHLPAACRPLLNRRMNSALDIPG
jgi:hypothetical protein